MSGQEGYNFEALGRAVVEAALLPFVLVPTEPAKLIVFTYISMIFAGIGLIDENLTDVVGEFYYFYKQITSTENVTKH
jgi:hypothetical protein